MSYFGRSFIQAITEQAAVKDEIKVVDDQHGTVTSALDLSEAILLMCYARIVRQFNIRGVWHFSNEGTCTWHDVAQHILKDRVVTPCKTEDFPRKAPRPTYSPLSCSKFDSYFSAQRRHWHDALDECVRLCNLT